MPAVTEIKTLGDIYDELDRVRCLVQVIYMAACSIADRTEANGLAWAIDAVDDDIERILAGLDELMDAEKPQVAEGPKKPQSKQVAADRKKAA